MHNWIVLYEGAFGLLPSFFKLKRGSICLKYIEEIFITPLNDVNNEVLWKYPLNYDLNVLIIC
jgi:hypothetical protein